MTGVGIVRLSKIAHMRKITVAMPRPVKRRGVLAHVLTIHLQTGTRRRDRPYWELNAGQREFSSAVKADFVRAMLNGEHTAEMMMPAAKKELEEMQEKFHKSCARWRRSQLPLASNHSSSDRTLARARAIAQSAAP